VSLDDQLEIQDSTEVLENVTDQIASPTTDAHSSVRHGSLSCAEHNNLIRWRMVFSGTFCRNPVLTLLGLGRASVPTMLPLQRM